MSSLPVAILGSNGHRNSFPTTTSRCVSEASSYSRSGLSDRHRRESIGSSKQSISTRDTSLSDDRTPISLTSPPASIKSGRSRRPRLMSVSRTDTQSTRWEAVDPLAFHHRSTRMFPSSPTSMQPHSRMPLMQRTTTSPEISRPRTATLSRATTELEKPRYDVAVNQIYQLHSPTESNESVDEPAVDPPVVIHWTSDETRRKEYADIDRSRKGLRGLWNKVAPKFARSGTNSRFYDENEGSDAGSVRRFRLDLPAEA